jgi:hypothetical protein
VAIGATQNDGNGVDSGHVRVYAWNGSNYVQRGGDIDGETSGDKSGHSVSLSSDGSILAIGAPYNDGMYADSGHVRVYAWNGSNYLKCSIDIDGNFAGDMSGRSISLSSNGNILAIGSHGRVRVFQLA